MKDADLHTFFLTFAENALYNVSTSKDYDEDSM